MGRELIRVQSWDVFGKLEGTDESPDGESRQERCKCISGCNGYRVTNNGLLLRIIRSINGHDSHASTN